MKYSNVIKAIRIIAFDILFLMLLGVIIVECVDIMKIRSILTKIAYIVCFLLAVILKKMPQFEVERVTILDFLSIVMFIGLLAYLGKGLLLVTKINDTFHGNNIFAFSYIDGDSDGGYNDIDSFFEDEREKRKEIGYFSDLEEIYRIQAEEKIFIYFKEGAMEIVEYNFLKQDDLYYFLGKNILAYDWIESNASYTAEETIRADIAHTMWRGVGLTKAGAPAWGVSTDENIFSMTINSENVDDVILIDEIDGKKYYFWIITNVGEIKTLDDVKVADIEMNSYNEKEPNMENKLPKPPR